MDQKQILIDCGKVMAVHLGAVGVNLSDANEWLKFGSLAIAIGYGIWKWRVDYLKNKANR